MPLFNGLEPPGIQSVLSMGVRGLPPSGAGKTVLLFPLCLIGVLLWPLLHAMGCLRIGVTSCMSLSMCVEFQVSPLPFDLTKDYKSESSSYSISRSQHGQAMMLLAQDSAGGISWQDGMQGPELTAGLLTKGDGRLQQTHLYPRLGLVSTTGTLRLVCPRVQGHLTSSLVWSAESPLWARPWAQSWGCDGEHTQTGP